MAQVERWPTPAPGPEDLAFDETGRLYTGLEDGRIIRLAAGGRDAEVIAATGGRPLGVELSGDGRVVVCDAYRGLLRLEADGTLAPAGQRP
ncbi:MAG: hypothetical protein ACRDHM_03300 [Actinomycetota bacterium]